MGPSEWLEQRIESLAKHQHIVWVEDPYGLLDEADLRILQENLGTHNQRVAAFKNAFRLRKFLSKFDPVSSKPKFVVIDQSYTTRDPHLLPQDAKPSDLVPLPAP